MEHIIRTETSLKLYRFIIRVNITLDEFAHTHRNCVLSVSSDWRCTYYEKAFTMNIFDAKKLPYPALVCMVFTMTMESDAFIPVFESLFGVTKEDIDKPTLVNWVEKYYTPHKPLDLEGLFLSLNSLASVSLKVKGRKQKPRVLPSYDVHKSEELEGYDSDYNNRRANQFAKSLTLSTKEDDGSSPALSMDQQSFCALVVHPFPEATHLAIEVFSSGVLNVAGIPTDEIFEHLTHYVNTKLGPLMEQHALKSNELNERESEEEDRWDLLFG